MCASVHSATESSAYETRTGNASRRNATDRGRVDEPTDERARVLLERGGEGVHGKGVVVGAGRAAVLVDDQDVHANLRRAVRAALAHQKGHVGDVEVVVDERVLVVVVVERVHVVVVVLGRVKARVGR